MFQIAPLIAITFFSLFSSAIRPDSQTAYYKIPDSKDGLEITAEIDKDTYQLKKDDILLTVTLKNVSPSPITICKRWAWDQMLFFSIEIRDEKGGLINSVVIAERRNEPSLSKEDFITIPPDKFIKKTETAPQGNFDFKQPGNYQISVHFYSFYSQKEAPAGIKFWDKKHGEIRSKPVDFKVVE